VGGDGCQAGEGGEEEMRMVDGKDDVLRGWGWVVVYRVDCIAITVVQYIDMRFG
jgi:hypothetical protein